MVFSSCRDWVVGLSSKKGQKKKKKIGNHRACDAKKGNMKVAIIRSTSWTAKVFKLRLFFFKSQILYLSIFLTLKLSSLSDPAVPWPRDILLLGFYLGGRWCTLSSILYIQKYELSSPGQCYWKRNIRVVTANWALMHVFNIKEIIFYKLKYSSLC